MPGTLDIIRMTCYVEAVVNPEVLADHPMPVQEVIRSIMTVFLRGILTGGAGEAFALIQSRQAGIPAP